MWSDHPLWGVGPGQFNARFPEYRTALTQLNPIHAHNEYLESLVEYGVAGFLLLVIFLARLFYTSFGSMNTATTDYLADKSKDWTKAFIISSTTAALTGFAVHAFFEFNFRIPALATTAAILVGTNIGLQQKGYANQAPKRSFYHRGFTAAICISASLAALPFWFHYAREDRFIYKSLHENQNTDTLIQNLKAAARAMPNNPDVLFWIGEEIRRSSSVGRSTDLQIIKEALFWLWRSEKINPHNARTKMTIGRCLTAIGQTNDALAIFQQAYKISPNDVLVINPLAGAYFQSGNLLEAKKLLDVSLSINDWDNKEARYYYDKLVDTTISQSKDVP
jgi:tetratricopeptide (TPR) repeat protein